MASIVANALATGGIILSYHIAATISPGKMIGTSQINTLMFLPFIFGISMKREYRLVDPLRKFTVLFLISTHSAKTTRGKQKVVK